MLLQLIPSLTSRAEIVRTHHESSGRFDRPPTVNDVLPATTAYAWIAKHDGEQAALFHLGANVGQLYHPAVVQAHVVPVPDERMGEVGVAWVVLREQPLVSLTLSQSFRRPCTASAARAFDRLRRVNPAPVTFFLNDGSGGQLFGASPDLQLVVQGRHVQALPVCGTVARGAGPVGEAESFRELVNEAVDAASLAVCSDALREDLAPLPASPARDALADLAAYTVERTG